MRTYKLHISECADEKMDRIFEYIINRLKNFQAAESVYNDYIDTCESLQSTAGTIRESDHEELRKRGLRRKNFHSHAYFVLFEIVEDTVNVTNVFHFREDYITKLN